jgi:ABC-type nitrate/sulfonate/bicarbonate transport system ATPase subunit
MVGATVEGGISIRQIDKIYENRGGGRFQALKALTLDVEPGEFVSIIGPSGCGKTTLLRIVAGLEQPSSGSLHVDGMPITGPDHRRGLVSQDPLLFPWKDIWHNVATGLEARGLLREHGQEVDYFLELVGLQSFAALFPHQLSGGMAQRAALARALVNRPKVLLMDEPLGALDALTRMSMQDEMIRIWDQRRTTILFITHDIDEAIYLSDRTVVMTEQPGQIRDALSIDLPRPRRRDAPEFFQYRRRLLSLLGVA